MICLLQPHEFGSILVLVVTQGIDFILVLFLDHYFIVIQFLWLSGGQEAIPYTSSESNFRPDTAHLLYLYRRC